MAVPPPTTRTRPRPGRGAGADPAARAPTEDPRAQSAARSLRRRPCAAPEARRADGAEERAAQHEHKSGRWQAGANAAPPPRAHAETSDQRARPTRAPPPGRERKPGSTGAGLPSAGRRRTPGKLLAATTISAHPEKAPTWAGVRGRSSCKRSTSNSPEKSAGTDVVLA